MGSTSVDLGFVENDFESWETESRHFPSKVGGRPAWLDLKHLPSSQMMTCPQCEKPRAFLLQVYAPDNNQTRAFHRTIYIFICKNEKCWNSESPPILVLRSQLGRDNPFYPPDPPQDSPSWRTDIVAQVPLCHVCGSRGNMTCSRCRRVSYCGQYCQKLDWKAGHKKQCQAGGGKCPPTLASWCLNEGLLEMEEEPERDDDFGGDRIQELVDEATKTGGSVNVDEDEWEAIERDQKEDKIMEKFKKRVRRCPDQVIRYDRRGLPLLCSSTPLPPAPPCNLCQGSRSFEFQVMPQLLSEMNLGSDSYEGGLDWGSIHVFTCDQSCHVEEGYVQEHFILQQFDVTSIPGSEKQNFFK